MNNTAVLRLPATELRQGPSRVLYQFGIDGKHLDLIATVSRVHRDDSADVQGYQRPEALQHIASIRHYLESDNPMIPNALVIAFDQRVQFEPLKQSPDVGFSRLGHLVIPTDESDPPGWIVDGQQRTAAVRDANLESFPMPAVAFITNDEGEQREQFILVNSVKPLPKSLIYELLPSTDVLLPRALARRRLPAMILDELNRDPDSPFFHRVQTPTNPEGVIKDNSILRMLENSLSDGILYRYRDPATGDGDVDQMCDVLNTYWRAVALVFPDAWEQTPRRSRLVHGVGIIAMGYLMDAIADYDADPDEAFFEKHILLIEPHCCWTAGFWQFGLDASRRWNELQNTPRDIQLLANHLLSVHRKLARDRSDAS